MILWVRLAIRNGLRNVRRTVLTAATVVVGVALVVVALSWITGIFGEIIELYTSQSGHIRVVDPEYIAREELQPLYANIEVVDPVRQAMLRVDGVVDVQPRIQMGVLISDDEELGDNFALAVGATREYYDRWLKGPQNLVAGRWLESEREAVLGATVAEQLEVEVGSEVVIIGQTQYGSMSPTRVTVTGVMGGDALTRQQIFLPLSEMQYVADIPDGAIELLVFTKNGDPSTINPVTDALAALPALEGLAVEAWFERQPWSTVNSMLDVILGFIQFFIVFVAALAIFNTMTMSVLERTQEIGVMRAMGLTRIGTLALFLVESAGIGLLGGVFGVLLGAWPALLLEKNGLSLGEDVVNKIASGYPMTETFYADFNADIVVQGIILGLVTAVVGALLPALRAAAVRPVIAMRARR